jgi:hypothetical protein
VCGSKWPDGSVLQVSENVIVTKIISCFNTVSFFESVHHHHKPITRSVGCRGGKADAFSHEVLHCSLLSAACSMFKYLNSFFRFCGNCPTFTSIQKIENINDLYNLILTRWLAFDFQMMFSFVVQRKQC